MVDIAKRVSSIIEDIVTILLILFAVFIIIQLILKIMGGSLETDELIVGLLIVNMGWSFLMSYTLWTHLGEHKGYRKAMQNKINK